MTPNPQIPPKPSLDGLEGTWARVWERDGVYRFDRTARRAHVYAIDTPPPTVSGSLHIGHVFSYTHTDIVARYRRMRGQAVFYPMGWDDNGLPTERRVQNRYGVRCDPSLPYDPDFAPPSEPGENQVPVARENFVELCHELTAIDERAFEKVWRRLGLSVDWSLTYTTIGDDARAASQRAFLRNLARGEAYTAEAPTLWDVTWRTAVAQAELEDRERPGAYHRIAFHTGEGPVYVETTRPELLPACVALVTHPDDERYRPLVGATVRSPLFDVEVPVVAHHLADPDKGSGIAMICTFGDITDVTWWRELDLPTRAVIGWDGRLTAEPPRDLVAPAARTAYAELAGKTVAAARARVVDLLRESGDLDGEPRPITHPVKFYERGERPLEIVTTRQWYIRNGGRDDALRAELLERGHELAWHPGHMRVRYDNWVHGLAGDWLISRQRFFGVPIPVWYRLDAEGNPLYDEPLVPEEADLPVDPGSAIPPGYTPEQRGEPGGFTGDPDVMDTWATSSLTPQIVGGWERDPDLFARVFPMDLRAQSHEIIRTWLFATLVRAHLEDGALPWRNVAISGWILDPDRKKMSKSKGNVMTPMALLEEYGSDAVRYWAASGRLGVDTAFDTGQIKIGRRLAIKLLNASRFVLGFGGTESAEPTAGGLRGVVPPGRHSVLGFGGTESAEAKATLDRSMLAALDGVVRDATAALEAYDHTRALERTERFFWEFCDDYLELVKGRAYDGDSSARAALETALGVLVRLFAPFLPFATEEVWSWWRTGSVHRAAWPEPAGGDGNPQVLAAVAEVLRAVRQEKSAAKRSMRAPVTRVEVAGESAALVREAAADLRTAGVIGELVIIDAADPEPRVSVVL